jgi:hypothetical protein
LPVSAALFCFIVLSAINFKRFSSISASVVVANLLQPLQSSGIRSPMAIGWLFLEHSHQHKLWRVI